MARVEATAEAQERLIHQYFIRLREVIAIGIDPTILNVPGVCAGIAEPNDAGFELSSGSSKARTSNRLSGLIERICQTDAWRHVVPLEGGVVACKLDSGQEVRKRLVRLDAARQRRAPLPVVPHADIERHPIRCDCIAHVQIEQLHPIRAETIAIDARPEVGGTLLERSDHIAWPQRASRGVRSPPATTPLEFLCRAQLVRKRVPIDVDDVLGPDVQALTSRAERL